MKLNWPLNGYKWEYNVNSYIYLNENSHSCVVEYICNVCYSNVFYVVQVFFYVVLLLSLKLSIQNDENYILVYQYHVCFAKLHLNFNDHCFIDFFFLSEFVNTVL